jgi:Uncharacterized protein conserved in bacteria
MSKKINNISTILVINTLLLISCHSNNRRIEMVKIKLHNGRELIQGVTVNSKKEGLWMEYDYDGNMILYESYFNNKLEGEIIGYYEDGKISSKGMMKNNLRNGPWIDYFHNGKIASKGMYINDKKTGVWESYIDVGLLNKKIEYSKDGERVILDNHYLPPPELIEPKPKKNRTNDGDSTAIVYPANHK